MVERQGKSEEAMSTSRPLLVRREKVFVAEHASTFASVYCAAHYHENRRYYDESVMCDTTRAMYRTIRGNEHRLRMYAETSFEMVVSQAEDKIPLTL